MVGLGLGTVMMMEGQPAAGRMPRDCFDVVNCLERIEMASEKGSVR